MIIGNKKGTFVFVNEARRVSQTEWERAQPRVLYPHAEKNSLTARDVVVHTPRASDAAKAAKAPAKKSDASGAAPSPNSK